MKYKDIDAPASKSTSIKVAIVEDDPAIRPLLAAWIEESDEFTLVGVFEDAETAATEILQQKPEIVLADINLPGASGIELIRKINQDFDSPR